MSFILIFIQVLISSYTGEYTIASAFYFYFFPQDGTWTFVSSTKLYSLLSPEGFRVLVSQLAWTGLQLCSGQEQSPPCSQVWQEQLFKVRLSELGGARVLQFYHGVCLLMVQVIGGIMASEEGLGWFLAKERSVGVARLAVHNSN